MMPNEYPQAPWMQDAGFMGQLLRALQGAKNPRPMGMDPVYGVREMGDPYPRSDSRMDLAKLAQSLYKPPEDVQSQQVQNDQQAELAYQQRRKESADRRGQASVGLGGWGAYAPISQTLQQLQGFGKPAGIGVTQMPGGQYYGSGGLQLR